MQERRPEEWGLQGAAGGFDASGLPTICSVTALQTAALEELTAGNVWRGR